MGFPLIINQFTGFALMWTKRDLKEVRSSDYSWYLNFQSSNFKFFNGFFGFPQDRTYLQNLASKLSAKYLMCMDQWTISSPNRVANRRANIGRINVSVQQVSL